MVSHLVRRLVRNSCDMYRSSRQARPSENESQKLAVLHIFFFSPKKQNFFPPCKIFYNTPVLTGVLLCTALDHLSSGPSVHPALGSPANLSGAAPQIDLKILVVSNEGE